MKAFLCLGAVLLLAVPAAAQPRPAAGECRAMSEAYGPQNLWWGRFSGGRENMWDQIELRTMERCFTQRAACQDWLYRLQSRYQQMPRWNECRQGYGPGAPVKPWWAPKR